MQFHMGQLEVDPFDLDVLYLRRIRHVGFIHFFEPNRLITIDDSNRWSTTGANEIPKAVFEERPCNGVDGLEGSFSISLLEPVEVNCGLPFVSIPCRIVGMRENRVLIIEAELHSSLLRFPVQVDAIDINLIEGFQP